MRRIPGAASTTTKALAILLLGGGLSFVGAETVPASKLPTKADYQRARVVCRKEIPTGSRIQVTRCQTQEQLANDRAQSRKYLKNIQDQSAMGPTPAIKDSLGH